MLALYSGGIKAGCYALKKNIFVGKIINSTKTSGVSSTDWVVDTQLRKLRDASGALVLSSLLEPQSHQLQFHVVWPQNGTGSKKWGGTM